MERNKLGKIHDWIVRILLILMFAACGLGLWFIFVGCEEFDGALSKECECYILSSEVTPRASVNSLGDTLKVYPDTVILNKKAHGVKKMQSCDGLKSAAEDSLCSVYIKCVNKE